MMKACLPPTASRVAAILALAGGLLAAAAPAPAQTPSVLRPPLPDLVIQECRFGLTNVPFRPQPVILVTGRNIGRAGAPDSHTSVLLTQTVGDGSGESVITSRSVATPVLAIGQSVTLSVPFTRVDPFGGGVLEVTADENQEVPELDETNNRFVAAFKAPAPQGPSAP
jgi:CARDB